jgi:hypothetical protein
MVTRVTGSRPKPSLSARCRPQSSPRQWRRANRKRNLEIRTGEVSGYSIYANDGDIGHVDGFVIDDNDWSVRYVVITRSWWPGKKVLLGRNGSSESVGMKCWRSSRSRATPIKDAPDWDDAQPITRAFEERLYDYYGLKRYWPIET